MTYMANGRQYIALAVGNGKHASLVTLALRAPGDAVVNTLQAKSDMDPESIYHQICVTCHGLGIHGAPRPSLKSDWASRLAPGIENVYSNAIKGLGTSMPARGQCSDCSDEQLKAVVDFMTKDVR